ncbi:MAG: hypothetical protein AB1847_22685 [bacterium]
MDTQSPNVNECNPCKGTGNKEIILFKVIVTIVAGCFLTMQLFSNTKLDNVSLALLVLVAVPWLVPFLSVFLKNTNIKSIDILGTKVDFLESKTRAQGEQILRQKELITTLYQAAQHNLTTYEYNHLVNLQSGNSEYYTYNDFLPHEMVRLCQHEFVKESRPGSTWQMKDKGDTPFNLKEFYSITDRGRDHILLIEKLKKRASAFGD